MVSFCKTDTKLSRFVKRTTQEHLLSYSFNHWALALYVVPLGFWEYIESNGVLSMLEFAFYTVQVTENLNTSQIYDV